MGSAHARQAKVTVSVQVLHLPHIATPCRVLQRLERAGDKSVSEPDVRHQVEGSRNAGRMASIMRVANASLCCLD